MKNIFNRLKINSLIIICGLTVAPFPAYSQNVNTSPKNIIGQNSASYDDIIGITLESNVVVDVIIRKITKLPPSQSIGVRSDRKRILITANVQSLIRGQSGLNSEIKFLFDAPVDSRGKIPKLKKQRFIAFGGHVPNRSDFIKLSRTASMLPYSGDISNFVRNSTREVLAANAPQQIIGINSAFHSPGTIIGEGETQIFLETRMNQPMAISINSRSGERVRWSVSASEVIDINATEPVRNSLMGYRLACGLPRTIGDSAIAPLSAPNQRIVVNDYNFIRSAIGPCNRTITFE